MKQVKTLLIKSLSDYKVAVKLYSDNAKSDMNLEEANNCDIALYLMQQAIEKCLKAYLRYYHVKFRKTHDIGYLLECCETTAMVFPKIPSIVKHADDVTSWEASTRYVFYEIEDIDLFYSIAFDYCTLNNFISKHINLEE